VLNRAREKKILKGAAFLGGNITVSPLSFIDEAACNADNDVVNDVVLELSSWQLCDLRGKLDSSGNNLLKPAVAVITAIMSDHQNWYSNMEDYVADKRVIYEGQDLNDTTVTFDDDDWGKSFIKRTKGKVVSASGDFPNLIPTKPLTPGAHQKKNLSLAALACRSLGLDDAFIKESLAEYRGLEHRLEFFYESGGVKFYNDSAATIPEAAAAAVYALDHPVIVTGGTDKNLEFGPLAAALKDAASVILLSGTGTDKLIPLLKAANIGYKGHFSNLNEAVEAAFAVAKEGDSVVLSPGCTSFGMFLNEFDRGKKWKEGVRKWT
jgi:UDP-N-acetylmuramoylalanine--D-glutamate ligase